ncbi:1,2-dihydroxy-3-keto-5-methylthiopentene dioxygenase [Amycolatopsis pretoriensis]|uniref:Acireductone dioxygenase n=1 Tax=Amycolatopsis pretoriensis TaxID=218821 RepID=A0A1H5RFJ0_9PSEU|nr:hypothetical protein [Amycolatopsis pretoriensis]SEF37120.1 1,2-dihydroxy-3-keto-5-methylthiopentene dioxygenase [Amycolatopsis pretoriensis]
MTLLHVMSDTDRNDVRLSTHDRAAIAEHLRPHDITLSTWRAVPLPGEPSEVDIITRYEQPARQLTREAGYEVVDVVSLRPGSDAETRKRAAEARAKFLAEHSHDEDEVRFFAHGFGCFYLHLDDRVHAVVCGPGDLLAVPAGIPHWFDMGENPNFSAIRFFRTAGGWVGNFTGDDIASRMPSLDELLDIP